ncbi:MAG: sugar phosphate isomerase/epimerase [Microbacterium sp.]
MSGVNFSCQTFSWQMSLDSYRGRIGHIARVAGAAGFSAIEPEIVMLGDAPTAERILAEIEPFGVAIPSIVLAEEWAAPRESDEERARADGAFALAAGLGAHHVVVVQKSSGRHDLAERQRGLMTCFDGLAERAADHGIGVSFHPNSLETSLFRDAADYGVLEGILPERVGFAPDLGHVARGGMDLVETLARFRDRVVHVHVKDMFSDGRWAPTGEGDIDLVGAIRHLHETGFSGWAAFEDESALAESDPDEATLRAGRWVEAELAPYRNS